MDESKASFKEEYDIGLRVKALMPALNEAGGVLVVEHGELKPTDPGFTVFEAYSMSVNENYLKQNSIFDVAGQRLDIGELAMNDLVVLVPEQYQQYEAKIKDRYLEWFDFQKYVTTTLYHEINPLGEVKHPNLTVDIRYIASQQRLFTHDVEVPSPFMNDAILTVITPETLDTDFHLSSLGRGVYTPLNFLESAPFKKSQLDEPIKQEQTVYDLALKKWQDTRANVLVLIGLRPVLVMTYLLMRWAHIVNVIKRRHFVQMTHGIDFWRRHQFSACYQSLLSLLPLLLLQWFQPQFWWVYGFVFVIELMFVATLLKRAERHQTLARIK